MATLINPNHPYLRIYNPVSGEYASFVGGRLDIEPADPNYRVVMDEAARNPNIAVLDMAMVLYCPECGLQGLSDREALSLHRHDIHFDAWLADRDAAAQVSRAELVKERSGIACDVCTPAQVLPDEITLARHMDVMHSQGQTETPAPPKRRRPGEVAPVAMEPQPLG